MRNFIILALLLAGSVAFADYHYADHEGSNEYPYTSWETAAHLIQDALDASEMFDTVYIGSGEYYELIEMQPEDSCVTIIGTGRDSVLIWTDQNDILFRKAQRTSFIDLGFRHLGTSRAKIIERRYFTGPNTHLYVNRCRFSGNMNAVAIMGLVNSTEIIENCIFDSLEAYDQTQGCTLGVFRNNICNLTHYSFGCAISIKGIKHVVENNIFSLPHQSYDNAISFSGPLDTLIIRNNIFKYFQQAVRAIHDTKYNSQFSFNVCDSFYLDYEQGALTFYFPFQAVDTSDYFAVFNNSFRSINTAIEMIVDDYVVLPVVSIDYNNFWDVQTVVSYDQPGYFDSVGNIFADPMYAGDNDYHLQAFSPLIDAGDPEILDLDSTRSDIGIYGGPLGEIYNYQDLPPRVPDSIYAYVESDTIFIVWRFNTEADFSNYRLYRDTISGFTPSVFNLIAEPDTSLYIDTDFDDSHNYYYKISAIDYQENVSDFSEELAVILTDIRDIFGPDVPRLTSVIGNYPNPFNLQTVIKYNVGNIGPMPVDITIVIYDVLGRSVRQIVEENKYPGEYEVIWDGNDNLGGELSSGVYFVKVIQWEGIMESKPRKIMLLK